jgi:hypothetical protein
MKRTKNDGNRQHGGITDKKDKNSGSAAFNQGVQQDPSYNEGVADGTPNPEKVSKEIKNPKTKVSDKRLRDDR